MDWKLTSLREVSHLLPSPKIATDMSNLGKVMVIAWPDTTARGDELWYKVLKGVGIVKNLNFKVGHAAILLISPNGSLHYYDFGRYITPRGFGRARSANSDPMLHFSLKAITNEKEVLNLESICESFQAKSEFTHGKGPMYFSIDHQFDFAAGKRLADTMVEKGSFLYGALAKNNSSCSRFVWDVFRAGKQSIGLSVSRFHETIMPSPISNVVNGSDDGQVYRFENQLEVFRMNRPQSLAFFLKQLSANFYTRNARELPSDLLKPNQFSNNQPSPRHEKYFYLNGLGESAWYGMDFCKLSNLLEITRYNSGGYAEYKHDFHDLNHIDSIIQPESLVVTYDSNLLYTTFSTKGQIWRLFPAKRLILNHQKNGSFVL